MARQFGNDNLLLVRFGDLEERTRALTILKGVGIKVEDWMMDPDSYRPWPETTHVLDVSWHRKEIVYCPPPFVCAAMASHGCRFYSVGELERMAELGFRNEPRYPIFHIPHDGRYCPEELMASVCVPKEVFMDYHERMRDKDVWQMIPRAYYTVHMTHFFNVSRLLCDVERFVGPEEIMEQYGMGFCYEKAYDGTILKHVTDDLKAATRKYYDEHHAGINEECEKHRNMLFFDMHSYTDEIIPPYARKENARTPDLCIGTDARFTPPRLKEIVMRRFSEIGFSIKENEPYSGFYIPETVLADPSAYDFAGIMLEFNRRIYCDGTRETLPEHRESIRKAINRIMADCVELE